MNFDGFGNLYVASSWNVIRKITPDGVVTTIAGAHQQAGSSDGFGTETRFNNPLGLDTDSDGNLYIADAGNRTIRRMTTSGNVTRAAGTTGVTGSGNGEATFATFVFPGDVAFGAGGLFIADGHMVRKLRDGVVSTFAGVEPLTLSPTTIRFGGIFPAGGTMTVSTPPQTVTVTWSDPGSPAWTVTADRPWVRITNGSGTGSGQFTVEVTQPDAFFAGSGLLLASNITLRTTDPALSNTVRLELQLQRTASAPVGVFDTPAANATGLQGSIAVTGWAVDDIFLDHVEIWRDPVPGETTPVYIGGGPGNGKIFIASPTFVPGARPDIENNPRYSHWPQAASAGWGYMLLTQGLWNRGNGTFTLYAFAFDREGLSSTLGTKTITIDNANANKPFGTIDTPSYGGTVSGVVTNFGWALTPGACLITNPNVQVSIDSGALSPVSYGDVRSDIAGAFPTYTNAAAAGGHFTLDTTTLTNGMHTIGWLVTDSCGRVEGVGSRFFTVANTASTASSMTRSSPIMVPGGVGQGWPASRSFSEGWLLTRTDGSAETPPDARDGTRVVRIVQGERIELQLPGRAPYLARQVVNGSPRDLPIGSSFEAAEGKFYWQPAAGFLGKYDLAYRRRTHRAGPRRRRPADPDGDRHAACRERARLVGLHRRGLGSGSCVARRRGHRHAPRVGVSRRRRRAGVCRRRGRRWFAAGCLGPVRRAVPRRRLHAQRQAPARHLRSRRLRPQCVDQSFRRGSGCQGRSQIEGCNNDHASHMSSGTSRIPGACDGRGPIGHLHHARSLERRVHRRGRARGAVQSAPRHNHRRWRQPLCPRSVRHDHAQDHAGCGRHDADPGGRDDLRRDARGNAVGRGALRQHDQLGRAETRSRRHAQRRLPRRVEWQRSGPDSAERTDAGLSRRDLRP